MKKLAFIFFYVALRFATLQAQPVLPVLTCTEVLANGDVQLSFDYTAPTPPDVIDSVVVEFTNNLSGGFYRSQVLLPPYLTPLVCTVTIPAPDANAQIFYFFAKVYVNGQMNPDSSNVMASILLNVSNATAGIAALSWNTASEPLLATATGSYNIYRQYVSPPNNSWFISDSVAGLVHNEAIIQCDDSVRFYVEMKDSLGCASRSGTITRYFLNAKPNTPKLQYVTWNPITSSIDIVWSPSVSADVTGYQVYAITGGTPLLIGTTNTINDTVFTYGGGSPQNQPEEFRIAAIDSCNKISNPGLTHNTIKLDYSLDRCSRIASFSWNAYLNWDNGVHAYLVYLKKDNFPYVLLGSTTQNTFDYTVEAGVQQLSVYVVATDTIDSLASVSPEVSFIPSLPRQPDVFLLRHATVRSDSLVELKLYHDTLAAIKEYRVMRADAPGGDLQQIGILPFSTLSRTIYFYDSLAFTDEQSYFYRIQCIDTCGNLIITSNPGSSIFIKGEARENYLNIVSWNPYLEWPQGTRHDALYSLKDLLDANVIPFRLQAGINGYAEEIIEEITDDGKYCYYVEAISNTHPILFFNDTSRSNIICIKQEPKLFIPNAFSPNNDELNDIFAPTVIFANDENYRLRIFNRFGGLIFETNDAEIGWDGNYQGNFPCQIGVYAYTLTYTNTLNKIVFRSGTLHLLR